MSAGKTALKRVTFIAAGVLVGLLVYRKSFWAAFAIVVAASAAQLTIKIRSKFRH